jgi:pimeloyl-ACP methyl ester carboxylesterase
MAISLMKLKKGGYLMIGTRISKKGIPYLHFGTGEPLVLIHGLGEIKEGWDFQYVLGNQFELIIPDLRGHGEYKTTKKIAIKYFASDVIGLLKELEFENANILGFSMGGAVAQEIYRQAPEMCRTLILASSFHYFPKSVGNILLETRGHTVNALTHESNREKAAQFSLYSWKEENIRKFHDHYNPNHEAFLKSLEACFKVNNISLLPTIKVPTLIIGGQYDSVIPVWMQLLMHKLIPHSDFVIMRNAGHMSKIEARDRFNRLIRNFLSCQKQVG